MSAPEREQEPGRRQSGIGRWLPSEFLLPESIQGRLARLLYFLAVYLLAIQILLLMSFGSVSRLLLVLLPAMGAPDFLTGLLAGGVLVAGLIWLLCAFVAGLRWIVAPAAAGQAGESKRAWFDLRKLPATALRYWRDTVRVVRLGGRPPHDG